MDTKLAFLDDPLDLGYSYLSRVVGLSRTASDEAEIIDDEYEGVEDGSVAIVKRAVDKNVVAYYRPRHAEGVGRSRSVQARTCQPPFRSFHADVFRAGPAPLGTRE